MRLILAGGLVIAGLATAGPVLAEDRHHGPDTFRKILIELAYADRDSGAYEWELDGWVGGDDRRLWLRSDGQFDKSEFDDTEAEIYFGRNIAPFWDALIGLRQDFEPDATAYLAASLVGLLPFYIESEASLYLSEDADLSFRLEQSADLRLTQKLIVEPHLEIEAFGSDVPERHVGAGLAEAEIALQLRYEITRKFAPFIEVEWTRKLGETASRARRAGEDREVAAVRLGLKVWL